MDIVAREDGRRSDQPRVISIQYDGLDRSDGSARFGYGDTKALASVSGPIEVRLAGEQASRATFEVLVRPLSNVPGTESKALASSLRQLLTPSLILTQNPRTLVQLVVQSLTPSPVSLARFQHPLIAAMINASTIAFVNSASVPMRGLVLASSVGRRLLGGASTLVVDPNEEETCLLDGSACFAFLFASDLGDSSSDCELVWSDLQTKSFFTEAELSSARELAKNAVQKTWINVKDSLSFSGSRQLWISAPDDTKPTRVPIEADDDDAKMEI